MPASSGALSIDEFASLVAAALSDIDVCGQVSAGPNSGMIDDGQEPPHTPPPTGVSDRPLLRWRRKKKQLESWSTSSAPFCGSTTRSFLDSPHHSIEYGDTEFTTTSLNIGSYSNISSNPQTGMTTYTGEPTVLAASMSTVDFGNCLGLGGGCAGACAGMSSSSRAFANPVCNQNTGGNVSTVYSNSNPMPTIPVFTLEVEDDAGLQRSCEGGFDLEPTLIDLSSSLRLPRTPPSFRNSAPDLHILDPPRNQYRQPDVPRTPRKSFFSKLKKQLSSKATSTIPLSDGSPTPFKLHLSLPLTPLSLSTPASPNPSRSPSPRFPFRSISGSYKRESAPPTTNVVPEKSPSPYNRSPTLSQIDCRFPSGKGRIHSLPAYNSDQQLSPPGTIAKKIQEQFHESGEQRVESNGRNRSDSLLSLADCMVSGRGSAQMNWMAGEPKRPNSISNGGGIKDSGGGPQHFPTFSHPDSDGALSDPSKYSCESASRSGRLSLTARNRTNSATQGRTLTTNGVVFPLGPESEPGSASQAPLPLQTTLPATPNHQAEREQESYAPFVPLVFQHERLQQKLQKSVPLTSIPAGNYETVACIKSVALKPYPPRTTSLSSATHVRQRTRSAPSSPNDERLKSQHHPVTPPIPMLPSHLGSVPTNMRNQPGTPMPLSKKIERPTTAPVNSTSNTFTLKTHGEGVIPFPVVKETELVGEESMEERQRKSSKLQRAKLKKNLLSPLQSSASTPPSGLPSALQSTENTNKYSDSRREGDSGRSVGLNYSLSLSMHPYAQARSSEGILSSPDESDAKAEAPRISKTSVTFVPSTIDGESNRLQFPTRIQRRFKSSQNLMPLSPTSPTSNSGSGSGSDASTKSPVTPRSPLFWTVGGAAGIAAAVKSRIGLGIPAPTSGSEEGNISAERKAYRDSTINSDSMITSVIKTSDDTGGGTKEYKSPHPYSQSYLTTSVHAPLSTEEENSTNNASPHKENVQSPQRRGGVDDRPSTASSINHRPSMQTAFHHGVAPSKPPPAGPLPFLPDTEKGKRGHARSMVFDNLLGEVPSSPVPSEYIKAFSHPSAVTGNDNDDDDDLVSQPCTSPSQSSESHEHDPEYEALLAANTRANVGELASMRNIAVGRRLMSGHPHPSSYPTSLKNEGKRKRVYSETARHPSLGGEWTLFLGHDGTPPRREEIIADLSSVPMTGIKTLSGVRARTKSESALKGLGLGDKSVKRARSSILAAGPNTHAPPLPPVPKLVKKQRLKSDDWTLSLPLLPPGETNPGKSSAAETDLARTRGISNHPSLIRGPKLPTQYPTPEVVVCVEGVVMGDELDSDEADDMTIAESQVPDTPFGLDIDSLDFEDDDSLLDFSTNSRSNRSAKFDHLLFSVPRVVSRGSGMESANWGEEVGEEIIKKKGRRLSDGLDSLMGMAGVSVRVDVNEDGESVCIVDGLSLNTEEVDNGSDEGWRGHESADPDVSDATKENLARLDALSADLKRFNELLKEGMSSTVAAELKHARSCGLLPSQTEAKSEHLRVQQSLETLRDICANSVATKPNLGVSVMDGVKTWTERSVSLSGSPNVPVPSLQGSPPPISMKSRPPLPFAPSSPPSYARPLSRGTVLGIGPTAIPSSGRGTGRAMTMATQTKPSHLKTVPPMAATIPDGVVGSGLKVGGNGRVISLSCSSAVTSTQTALLRVITDEPKDPRAAVPVVQSSNDVDGEGNGNDSVLEKDTKRNSASSFTSTDSYFTSFSSPSQTPTPHRKITFRSRQGSLSSDCGPGSSSSTPTATSPPSLRIITSSTTNSTRAQSPVDDVHTPSSSAMPTPLASSFPKVPPLPVALSSLGEDLKTVSKMLAGTFMSRSKTREADEPVGHRRHATDCVASSSRLSTASDMSVRTVVAEQQANGSFPDPFHSASEAERDAESTYSDSFYSARSSFEA